MTRSRRYRSKIATLVIATLSGGSLFTSCDTRFREAAVGGAKSYLFNDFLPALVEGFTGADSSTEADSTQ